MRPISHFPAGDESELSPEIQALYAKCREKLGFVPNVFLAYQWRPSRLAAWMQHFDAVMQPTESLPAAEREMIAVAVSMANACSYCLVAHGYSVRKLTRDPVNGDLITLDYKRAEITPRQRAMLDYARVLTVAPAELEEADLERAARARAERRGHLGRDRDRVDVQLHEPHGARHGDAAEPRVPRHGALVGPRETGREACVEAIHRRGERLADVDAEPIGQHEHPPEALRELVAERGRHVVAVRPAALGGHHEAAEVADVLHEADHQLLRRPRAAVDPLLHLLVEAADVPGASAGVADVHGCIVGRGRRCAL